MSIIAWLVVGLIAGWLASIFMKTDAAQGPLTDIIVGVIGALIGGFVMNFFGQAGVSGIDIYSIFVATLGAIILIALKRAIA